MLLETYEVKVGTQLSGFRGCSVTNGAGIATTNVTNVSVSCGDLAGSVSTVAGSGVAGSADGTDTAALFKYFW